MVPGGQLRTWLEVPAKPARLTKAHPVLAALDARLAELERKGGEAAAREIAGLFGDLAWLEAFMADVADALAEDRFADASLPIVQHPAARGLVLADTPAASVICTVAFAEAITPTASVTLDGNLSVFRIVRGGPVAMRYWHLDGEKLRRDAEPTWLSDGDVVVIDGRREAHMIERAASDLVMLRAIVKVDTAPLARAFDAGTGRPIGLSSNDEAASRTQMMLTLLRLLGRRDAAPCFAEALAHPHHFVRWHAMREWLALDAAAALPRLRDLAEDDPDDEVRIAASRTIEKVAARCRG